MSLTITPETKLHDLLEAWPALEEKLLSLSPQYAKLRNPVLRATIARIATLRQVAQVGQVPLAELINTLRAAVGQETGQFGGSAASDDRPAWFAVERIALRLDARPLLAAGEHPLNQVLHEIQTLPPQGIYELTTPFLPAPLLEAVGKKGFAVWTLREEADLFRNYFCNI
ncbi:MAG TPA: DUF1858 domain-containing protein [bacterium]|nr:DUF1858 domain-containing protein [bacterium]HPR89623.1 DUF1858 domain-containing protein [bacterium]